MAGPLRPAARGGVRRHRRPGPGPLAGVPPGASSWAGALAASTAACLIKIVHAELARELSSTDSAWLSPPSWLLIAAASSPGCLAAAISAPARRAEQAT